jgi:NAD(P)-dependent dehydrogenase (short-subunit alcohol dehydrogenase family)
MRNVLKKTDLAKLKGKLILVTGASRGIGATTAQQLAARGANLILSARNAKALKKIASRLRTPTHLISADLLDERSISRFASKAMKLAGTPDALVCIAGVWHNKQERYQGPQFWETSSQRIDEVLGVGLIGSMKLIRAFLPEMIRRQSGHIILLGCGFAGPHEAKGWLHYYVTNKAIAALTRGLAAELRPFCIRVNCIAPWFVATEYVKEFYPDDASRALPPVRVAEAIIDLLVGPLSKDVSGQIIELRSDQDV